MDFSRFNIAKIMLSFVLSLGLLLAGWLVYQEFGVIKPMYKEILAIPGVRGTEIANEQGRLSVTVDIGEVDRIQPFYQEIKKILPDGSLYDLTFSDRRNAYLSGLWRENRFAVEEAAAKSNLTEMQQLIEANVSREAVDYWLLEVDGENIYFQVHDDGYYLYEVVPRTDKARVSEKR